MSSIGMQHTNVAALSACYVLAHSCRLQLDYLAAHLRETVATILNVNLHKIECCKF